jgi:hypothetical protein
MNYWLQSKPMTMTVMAYDEGVKNTIYEDVTFDSFEDCALEIFRRLPGAISIIIHDSPMHIRRSWTKMNGQWYMADYPNGVKMAQRVPYNWI